MFVPQGIEFCQSLKREKQRLRNKSARIKPLAVETKHYIYPIEVPVKIEKYTKIYIFTISTFNVIYIISISITER